MLDIVVSNQFKKDLRQHRTIGVCGLRSKIFRQVVQKDRRLAGASQEIFVQHDGNRFKQGVRRDLCGVALKLAVKRGYDLDRLERVVSVLAREEALGEKYRDHALTGHYSGFRECHIQPDWLLIYRVQNETLILFLSRTGTHSDLF